VPGICSICGKEKEEQLVEVCKQAHDGDGPVIGGAAQSCPVRKGAIWVRVLDDGNTEVQDVPCLNSKAGSKDTDDLGLTAFDPLDEGSDYDITIGPLPAKLSDKYALPVKNRAEAVPVHQGQITSVEFRLERLSTLKVVVKHAEKDEYIKNVKVTVTGPSPDRQPETPDATTPDSGLVDFKKLRKGKYGVRIALSDDDQRRYRIEDADNQEWDVDPSKSNEVTFKLTPVIRICLKLFFKDPEDNTRTFPKDFEFALKFEAIAGTKKVKLNDKGVAGLDGKDFIEVPRAAKGFTIDLKQDKAACIVCEKRGADKTQELIQEKDPAAGKLFEKLKAESRMFLLPGGEWTLKNSAWDIKEDGIKTASLDKTEYKFQNLEALEAEVGSVAAPVELTLKPAWQFAKFVYYDRKLKGDDPISIPSKPNGDVLPVHIEGWRKKDDEKAGKAPDATSLWHLGDDEAKTVQCVPWIIGSDGTNAAEKIKPDKDTLLRFRRKESFPFIQTTSATDRKLIDLTDADKRDKPSTGRLDYYDLPKVWKSRAYFGWLSDSDGDYGPYEDIAEKGSSKDKPIVFSLDDMVLTKDDLSPVPWDAANRVALLSHTFSTSGAAPASTGPAAAPAAGKPQKPTPKARRWLDFQGLYNPDADAPKHECYFSKVKMEVNYVADHPHWTRAVACKGNLFDVFDKRTPDHDTNVVGARAAVMWLDAVTGRPANSQVTRPARKDTAFCSLHPLYEQEFAQRFQKVPYNHASPSVCRLGRFDLALFRCCDVDGADEKAVNLVYFRMNFAFPAIDPAVQAEYADPVKNTAGLPVPDLSAPKDAQYAADFVTNVAKRWNGLDGSAPAARGLLLSRESPTKPFKAEVVWFGQSLPASQSQFACNVVITGPTSGARSWFDGANGRGELSPKGCADEGNWFVGAHECGHGVSLNDDYCERWDAQSYGQLSLRWHTPGDPYEPDGRIVEFQEPGAGLMNGNQEIRNRYLWHCAEWVRQATGLKLKVKLGAYDDYWLPPHTSTSRTFAFWPMAAKANWEPDSAKNRGKCTIYAYALGAERYTHDMLPGHVGKSGPFDGILVVVSHLAFTFVNWGNHNESNRKRVLRDIAASVRQSALGMNGRFQVSGSLGGSGEQAWRFNKCLIHFSPRFVVSNHHTEQAKAVQLRNAMGFDFEIDIPYSPVDPAAATWDYPNPAAAEIMTEADWTSGTGSRSSTDPDLQAIDTLIRDYHALDEARLPERVEKLKEMVQHAERHLTSTTAESDIGLLFDDVGSTAQELRRSAETLKDYLERIRTSRKLRLDGKEWNDVPDKFVKYYPSMFGIYKPCSEVVATDLESLVKQVIPDAVVSALT
jgi:hypothetical protein